MKLYAALAIFGIALILVPQDSRSEDEHAQDDNGRFKRKAGAASKSKTKTRGKEDCPQNCQLEYKPVCGSNGQTYNNECLLNIVACVMKPDATLTKESDGACDIKPTNPPETKRGGANNKKGDAKKKGKRHALSHLYRGLRKRKTQNQSH